MLAFFTWPDATQIAGFTTLLTALVGGIIAVISALKSVHARLTTVEENTNSINAALTLRANTSSARANLAEGVLTGAGIPIPAPTVAPTVAPTKKQILPAQFSADSPRQYYQFLSWMDITSFALKAGFIGGDLATAVAIAFAESAGNPNAKGDNGMSLGLWQVDTYYHPEFDNQNLYDPQTNANAAYAIYKKANNSFTPWSTYKSGAYRKFL